LQHFAERTDERDLAGINGIRLGLSTGCCGGAGGGNGAGGAATAAAAAIAR